MRRSEGPRGSSSRPWTASFGPPGERDVTADDFAVVLRGAHAGRVVATGAWGVAVSDDGGTTWATRQPWWFYNYAGMTLTVLTGGAPPGTPPGTLAAGGGDRIVLTTLDPARGGHGVHTFASDDGGESWRYLALVGEQDSYIGAHEVVDLGGGRALMAKTYGHLYETTDSGRTWTSRGAVPETVGAIGAEGGRVAMLLVGPDGHLYAASWITPPYNGRLWRTALPYAVAASGAPAEATALGLRVAPNPSATGALSVALTLQAPAASVRLTVTDALGRTVWTERTGAVPPGETAVRLGAPPLPAGVYVVRAEADGAAASARTVVVR